jgi:AraC family transcriptional regulator, exoenzyme S synthesis regulatory protein ExsA
MINLYEAMKSFPSFSRQLRCRDLLFTQYDCPQTERKEKFYLECNAIIYVISGRRIFHKNNKSWTLDEGVCVFVKKGTHISEKEADEKWCAMAFFLPDHFIQQLVNEHVNNLPLTNLPEVSTDHILPLHVSGLCQSFFYSMLSYFSQTPPPPENLLELKFKELMLSLLTHENKQLLSYLNNLRDDKHTSIDSIMEDNYTFNLSLEEYAKLACKSVPTFKREFKRIYNDSPARWVMKKRLNLATTLLQNTSHSIGDITRECGFENQTHFSRIFKEKIGVSPLQFRANYRSTEVVK